jgi:hypothetical protein
MKPILVVAGCGLLLLALVLLGAAVGAFVMARRKRAASARATTAPSPARRGSARFDATTPTPAPPPAAVVPPPVPSAPAVAEPMAQAVDPSFDPNATIVVNTNSAGTLVCTAGALEGRSFPLTDRGLYIGRDWAESQIVIDDLRVSKRHVWVGIRGGKVVVVDQGSTNGTFLNSLANRVTEAVLAPGDTLVLPENLARFTLRK